MKMVKDFAALIFLALAIAALVIAGPLLSIWALNTLFPAVAIEYTVWTWLAALILFTVLSPKVRIKK